MDPIPELPLASAKRLLPATPRLTNERTLTQLRRLASRVRCYSHVKTLIHVTPDGTIVVNPTTPRYSPATLATALSTRGEPLLQGVKDHLLSSYIRNLERG